MPSTPAFIHLRLHSEFSLIDSLIRINPLMQALKQQSLPAVALTDQSNICATIKFYKAAQMAGIKPICGCDIWLSGNSGAPESVTRMTLLAMNKVGYSNIIKLTSRSYQEGQNNGKAVVHRDWLQQCNSGLIVLSGADKGEIGQALINRSITEAKNLLLPWLEVFKDRFYLEIQRTGRANDERCLHLTVDLAQQVGVPLVATNEVVFIHTDEFEAHETRVCINQGMILDDPDRPRNYSPQQYLRSEVEMVDLFNDLPSALTNSVEIAQRCNLDIELGKCYLPNFPVPDGQTMDTFFRQISAEGLGRRLQQSRESPLDQSEQWQQRYVTRLKLELDIIIQMGFSGYFLIVMDFIHWARQNQISVGPGRGSGAGSLVAYALEITDIDPLKYDLLFERFLNPERVSMPDFDIDFCMDERDRVIEYVAETYGKDAVAQIITFGTMAAKAVIRDVARVQGKPFGLADRLSKLIPFEVGMTLRKAMEQEQPLRDFVAGSDEVQEIMDMAYQLEGIIRNIGKHAGGVVIAPTRLTDFSALYCDVDGAGLITQYDKSDVEDAGLVKFDFLGLRTLTIIDCTVDMINQKRHQDDKTSLRIDRIDLMDAKVFEFLQQGETTGVFQLESRGIKELIKRLSPSTFEDIIALVALFRPGPLQSGMVDDFINRKHGREQLAWPHPDYQLDILQPILEPTYGIILYQEQVMQIAQVMASYTLGQADMLRRAMGKKQPKEMARQRNGFLSGSEANGIDRALAGHIFDLVEKFAGYGFNKSHSVAYALVSYQTAWLKTHYPAEFMAAVLSADMQNIDKVVLLVEECRHMQLPLMIPDVNTSQFKFTVNEQGQIVYGLGALKGVGEGPVLAIIDARRQGDRFIDLFEFCVRVGARKVNKRVLEVLVSSGACDSLGTERSLLYAAIPDAIQAAEQHEHNQNAGMVDLFGNFESVNSPPTMQEDPYSRYRHLKPFTLQQRLQSEKDVLGLYVTGHPIDAYEAELACFIRRNLDQLVPTQKPCWVAGMVVARRTVKNRHGNNIAFITLDDLKARVEVALFTEVYDRYYEYVQVGQLLVIEGDVSADDYSGGLKVNACQILNMVQARAYFASGLRLELTTDYLRQYGSKQLQQLLSSRRVNSDEPASKLYLGISNGHVRGLIDCASSWQLQVDDDLLIELEDLLGVDAVLMDYQQASGSHDRLY